MPVEIFFNFEKPPYTRIPLRPGPGWEGENWPSEIPVDSLPRREFRARQGMSSLSDGISPFYFDIARVHRRSVFV